MKYIINNMGFNNKAEIKTYYRNIFESYNRGEILSREDHVAIWYLLKFHDKYEEKTEKGIKSIKVDWKEYNNNAFWINHHDGTSTSFSYPHCIKKIPVPKKQTV